MVIGHLSIELHIPGARSLKDKRMVLRSVRDRLRRLNVAVSELEHQDLWQRAGLTAAIVGRDARSVDAAAAGLERHVVGRFPDGASFRRSVLSAEEVLG